MHYQTVCLKYAVIAFVLMCFIAAQEPVGTPRLTMGTSASNGFLEVMTSMGWRAVCPEGFGFHEAGVVCFQLGFNEINPKILLQQHIPSMAYPQLQSASCVGHEADLYECGATETESCTNLFRPVGLDCFGEARDDLQVRFLAGTESEEFRPVEINYNGVWGLFCGYRGGVDFNANPICGLLGLPSGALGTVAGDYPGATVHDISLRCHNGREFDLENCDLDENFVCNAADIVAVSCGEQGSDGGDADMEAIIANILLLMQDYMDRAAALGVGAQAGLDAITVDSPVGLMQQFSSITKKTANQINAFTRKKTELENVEL